MRLDQKTREFFAQPVKGSEQGLDVSKLFENVGIPCSGSFNGYMSAKEELRLHINPRESVKLTQEKDKLFQLLALRGYPMPKFFAAADCLLEGYFAIEPMEEMFGDEDVWKLRPLRYRNKTEILIADLDDALSAAQYFHEPFGVVFQTAFEVLDVIQITAIPGMRGKDMRCGGNFTKTGAFPTRTNPPILDALIEMAVTVLDEIDLDYGTVTMGYKENDIEIFDLSTNLVPAHAEGLNQYLKLMADASKTRGKRSK